MSTTPACVGFKDAASLLTNTIQIASAEQGLALASIGLPDPTAAVHVETCDPTLISAVWQWQNCNG